jgi:hypothetical protein
MGGREWVARCFGKVLDRGDGEGSEPAASRGGWLAGEGGFLGTQGLPDVVDAEAVGHDHDERAAVDKGEFLPEEVGVGLRLIPEFGDGAEVGEGRD